jgi:hypothetical protein
LSPKHIVDVHVFLFGILHAICEERYPKHGFPIMVSYEIVYLMGSNMMKVYTIGDTRKLPQETLIVSKIFDT